jgi:threonine/homoserine/homoserine lactone efflux protein
MLGVTDYGAFVAAIIVFLLIPGPGNLALITSTGKGGIQGGLGATFGFMAVTIAVLTFAYGMVAVLLTHFLAERLRAIPVVARSLEKLAGLFLIGFGIKLVATR